MSKIKVSNCVKSVMFIALFVFLILYIAEAYLESKIDSENKEMTLFQEQFDKQIIWNSEYEQLWLEFQASGGWCVYTENPYLIDEEYCKKSEGFPDMDRKMRSLWIKSLEYDEKWIVQFHFWKFYFYAFDPNSSITVAKVAVPYVKNIQCLNTKWCRLSEDSWD